MRSGRLSSRFALACFLSLAVGIAWRRVPERVVSAGRIEGPSCGLDRRLQPLPPDQLVKALVMRASAGEFATSGEWLRGAVDCPDREPGSDSFSVVRGYTLGRIDSHGDTVRYQLRLNELGYQTLSFHRLSRISVDTISVHRTRYGWRVRSPSPWNWLSISSAIREGWVGVNDSIGP